MAITQPQPKPNPQAASPKGPIELPQSIFFSEKPGEAPAEPPPSAPDPAPSHA